MKMLIIANGCIDTDGDVFDNDSTGDDNDSADDNNDVMIDAD